MKSVSLNGLRVAVAGAGVFGLSIAALAARRGAEVTVFDPAARGDNASGVAAGMLSPALETAMEGGDAMRHALFRRAYVTWPDFAADLGLPLPDCAQGAVRTGDPTGLAALAERLQALGVEAQWLGGAAVRARQPLYAGDNAGLFVVEDRRLDPAAMIDAMVCDLLAHGARFAAERVTAGIMPADHDRLVIATGYEARAWAGSCPELAPLAPVKGHILHYALAGQDGATVRADGGYLAPQPGHVAFGATMEPGRADRTLDAETAASLHAQAVALAPVLAETPRIVRAGVRASTPDGLPMVGVSAGGAMLAVGARRNGWLLAPLVAEAGVEALAGAAPWPQFDPARFGTA